MLKKTDAKVKSGNTPTEERDRGDIRLIGVLFIRKLVSIITSVALYDKEARWTTQQSTDGRKLVKICLTALVTT